MNFDTIKPDEIKSIYNHAADKPLQVKILSQLMCCEEADVCDFLGIPHTKKRERRALDEMKAFEMHKNGATNEEIAEAFGVTVQAVYEWKKRSGINKIVSVPEETLALFKSLYEQGNNDLQISEKTGESIATVRIWRKQNKLKANCNRIYRDWEQDDKNMMPLYEMGCTDEQISKSVGCQKWNVRDWRKRNGLKAHIEPRKNYVKRDWTEIDKVCRPLYEMGMNDPQISEKTGIEKRTVCAWRGRKKLPSQRSLKK